MDIDKLENPFIKVTWEDIPENFTQEKILYVVAASRGERLTC